MSPEDTARIYDLLKDISDQLGSFRQETEKRLAALEERISTTRMERLEDRLGQLEQFKATASVKLAAATAIAGSVGAGLVALVFRAMHTG